MFIEKSLDKYLLLGENVSIEFKRCGGNIEHDVYETVCSFSNRFGGDIFLGILDNGKIEGVSKKSATEMIRNFVSVISNPNIFFPTLYLSPEIIQYENKIIIHIHVPNSSEVHTYKKVIYDRIGDSDIKLTSTSQIAQLYIRKQEIFTEKKIYPYVTKEDLRQDLLLKVRLLAKNNAGGSHPWDSLTDEELYKSAGLFSIDRVTGEKGFNLAAVLLLGKDDLIQDVCPTYGTDALLRRINVDRYDDRDIINTNLIDSFDRLFDFAKKHLKDKFYVEDAERKSLRNIIAREMLVNTLIHREFSSSFQAKFVIEKDKMFIENANRAISHGIITLENLEPNPKNPIIASFFRNIGYSDRLGSGVRKLFKYCELYSEKKPEFIEDDIFKISVPLDEDFFKEIQEKIDVPQEIQNVPQDTKNVPQETENVPQGGKNKQKKAQNRSKKVKNVPQETKNVPQGGKTVPQELKNVPQGINKKDQNKLKEIFEIIKQNPTISREELAKHFNVSVKTIARYLKKMNNRITYSGSGYSGYWEIKDNVEEYN